MAGPTAVVGTPDVLEVIGASNGQSLSMIPYLVGGAVSLWWQLASDGSYICAGSSAGLYVFTPAGQLVLSQAGNYIGAQIFAAPGEVLVADGPAGQNVIETISTVNGTSTVSSPFSGTFYGWFLDGSRFLTTLVDTVDNTVWVDSNTGVEQAVVDLPTTSLLAGQGNWIWTYDSNTYAFEIYAIGSGTPAFSYTASSSVSPVLSGSTIGLLSAGLPQMSVIDLSGSTPTIAMLSRSDCVPWRIRSQLKFSVGGGKYAWCPA